MKNAEEQKNKVEQDAEEATVVNAVEAVAEATQMPVDGDGEPADAGASETAAEEAEPTVEEKLVAANERADENYANYLRAVADLDNYRRRVVREKDELRQFALAGLLESFLPVYDNLSLGLMSAEQSADPKVVVQGIQMVLVQFRTLLEENGITEIAPDKGADFDPNRHDAFQTQPSEEVEEGKVLQLVRKGFALHGRVLRAANVIVAGKPNVSEDASDGEA